MSTGANVTEADRGYLSEESKRRFTLVAGVLGAVFFLAQMVLPMVLMFLIMTPMMVNQELATLDVDRAALWGQELWLVRRTTQLNWSNPGSSAPRLALVHWRLTDLSDAGPAIPLDVGEGDPYPALLPLGDRLWVIGTNRVAYYQGGSLMWLQPAARPPRASTPFVLGGRPAVISLGTEPALATLHVEGQRAEWTSAELPLGIPPEGGSLRALQAVESGGRLYLFAQLCTESPEQCSLSYRAQDEEKWASLVNEVCSCANWTAVALSTGPAVVVSEAEKESTARITIVTGGANGPQTQAVPVESGRLNLGGWRALSSGDRVVLVSQGMPGSLRLVEVVGGRVERSVRRPGSFPFPFGSTMMAMMVVPQLVPIVLSLILAFLLTVQMRRHRVQDYVFGDQRRTFASLWQRALAQLVDVVPFVAAFLLPMASWSRMFSDPERFIESGPLWFPLAFLGLFIGAFLWVVAVLVAFSYLEGRFGKTPGKWLLGIRVLGTDLKPCGFGRALVRNSPYRRR